MRRAEIPNRIDTSARILLVTISTYEPKHKQCAPDGTPALGLGLGPTDPFASVLCVDSTDPFASFFGTLCVDSTDPFRLSQVSCGSGQLGMRSRVSFLADLLANKKAHPQA